MKLFQLIQECKNIGVHFFTEDGTTLSIEGDYEMAKQKLPMLDERKAEIMEHLSATYSEHPYIWVFDTPLNFYQSFGDDPEIDRIASLAWEFISFYDLTHDEALEVVSEIIAPGGVVECETAYEKVRIVRDRLRKAGTETYSSWVWQTNLCQGG